MGYIVMLIILTLLIAFPDLAYLFVPAGAAIPMTMLPLPPQHI
ncbi:MAG: hypothetical protein SF123_07825 [Chloroflexota bacterium]|nr:hypothetical protein [Chloroflexota bacterium]